MEVERIVGALLLLIAVYSCKKDDNDSPDQGPMESVNQERIVSIESGDDSTSITRMEKYLYDGDVLSELRLYNVFEDSMELDSWIEFDYSQGYVEGRTHSKIGQDGSEEWEIISRERYHHDSQGRLEEYVFYDEYFGDEPEPVRAVEFGYENGMLAERIYFRNLGNELSQSGKTLFGYQNGRLISEEGYSWDNLNEVWNQTSNKSFEYVDGNLQLEILWTVESGDSGDTTHMKLIKNDYSYSGTRISSLERFYYTDGVLDYTQKMNYFYNEYGNIEIMDKVYDSSESGELYMEFYSFESGDGNYRQLSLPTDFISPVPQPKSNEISKVPGSARFTNRIERGFYDLNFE